MFYTKILKMAFRRFGLRRRRGRVLARSFKRKRRRTATKKITRIVARMEETKWSTFQAVPAPVAATPVGYTLNNMQKGTDRNTRIANRIRMVSLELSAWIQGNPALTTGQVVRAVVFLDKQANGVLPTIADMMNDPTVTNQYNSLFNPNTVPRRYQILMDKKWMFDPVIATTTTPATGIVTTVSAVQRMFRRKISLKLKQTLYNDANAGTVADIIKPALYIYWFTDVATAPIIAQEVVFRFKDA